MPLGHEPPSATLVSCLTDRWPQLNAVYEHGLARARSHAFHDQTRVGQWMRLPGDVVFSLGAVIMGWDFLMKLRGPSARTAPPLVAQPAE